MKAFYFVLQAFAWMAAFLFIAVGCMLTYEVLARYLFIAPTIWASELSQLCLMWGTMLAMPWLLKTGRHIAVDAVTDQLSPAWRRVCHVLAMGFVAVFSILVAWKGGAIFYDSFERGRTSGTMLDLPMWISELSIPVGFALLFLQAVLELGQKPKSGDHEAVVME
ncbi:TRAP transporter small permease [Stappia sp. BW2]|uniref:TRAP transporter small permease n=1 Tax=Stappia sp. BW2 TaxID=2592622 RepID=UPI0011DEBB73|nr:TRAP transporter small permease [Stappia sp. BW2]TYC72408.1 TRAP transporter small permease [Stappia sp. BW2]